MVIKTLRDAEQAIKKLTQEVGKANTASPDLSLYATKNFVSELIASNKTQSASVTDSDTVVDENRIIHSLEHYFNSTAWFKNGAYFSDLGIFDSTYSWNFVMGGSGKLILQEEQGQSVLEFENFGAGVTTNKILVGGNFEPLVDNTYNIGSAAKQIKKLFAVDTELSGVFKMTAVTASRPAKFDASKQMTSGLIDLGTEVTGILAVSKGGTGNVSFTAGRPLIGDGTLNLFQPGSVYNGTFYVASASGGAVTTAKNVSYGIITS